VDVQTPSIGVATVPRIACGQKRCPLQCGSNQLRCFSRSPHANAIPSCASSVPGRLSRSANKPVADPIFRRPMLCHLRVRQMSFFCSARFPQLALHLASSSRRQRDNHLTNRRLSKDTITASNPLPLQLFDISPSTSEPSEIDIREHRI